MCERNQTEIKQVLLLGFRDLHHLKWYFFTLILLIYVAIMTGNLLILILVTTAENLKNVPMFYFLKYLALADGLLVTNVIPFALVVIIMEGMTILFVGCTFQLYIFGISGFAQCFLLAVMSYDRYLAICQPFRYTLIMTPNLCLLLVCGCWLLVFILISTEFVYFSYSVKFCGRNDFQHFICDIGPLMELSTSDTSVLELLDLFTSTIMTFVPFVFIVGTYILVFLNIIKIQSASGRKKFFSTCTSHLTAVCTYYVTLVLVYIAPAGENPNNVNSFRTLLYSIVPALVNPIIYSLKNQDIKAALGKVHHCILKTECRKMSRVVRQS